MDEQTPGPRPFSPAAHCLEGGERNNVENPVSFPKDIGERLLLFQRRFRLSTFIYTPCLRGQQKLLAAAAFHRLDSSLTFIPTKLR
jgi:hypothetical protein